MPCEDTSANFLGRSDAGDSIRKIQSLLCPHYEDSYLPESKAYLLIAAGFLSHGSRLFLFL